MTDKSKQVVTKDINDIDVVKVKDMLSRVKGKISDFSGEIDDEFAKELNAQLKAAKYSDDSIFISRNKLWDMWFQKLFGQLISVKLWVMALITILLVMGFITNAQFATIIGVVMGLKGAFSVADVWKRQGSRNMLDKI